MEIDPHAAEELFSKVYEQLRRLAAHQMQGELFAHTLQPTALVHEAWMRLASGKDRMMFENRRHFVHTAAEVMRRILIDRARRRLAAKRGAGTGGISLDMEDIPIASPLEDDEALLGLNEALEKLHAVDPRKAELVKLRYFVGMNYEEVAATMGIAVPTAKQWWAYARAWLAAELRNDAFQ